MLIQIPTGPDGPAKEVAREPSREHASLIADAYRFDSSYLPQEKKEKIVYPDHESEIFTGAA